MIPSTTRVFVCTEAVDMRRSFDGLAREVVDLLGEDPRSGSLFCFTNKRANRLKVIWWEKTGYCMLYKRMHGALVVLPRDGKRVSVRVDARQLAILLTGVARPSRTLRS